MVFLWLAAACLAQAGVPQLPKNDAIRVREFYRVASDIQDKVWPGWSGVPTPLIVITSETEFLTHDSKREPEFEPAGEGWFARPRKFPTNLQATFPLFGPPPVIAIGVAENTASKTSTPWIFTVMHEHFHQLQWAQPGYIEAVNGLGLSHGDQSGMWMLNYPFPYEKPELVRAFSDLRDLLLRTLNEPDGPSFQKLSNEYLDARKKFFAQLSADDHKYLSFQLWQEGMARYTELKSAEEAAHEPASREYAALPDFESFSAYGARVRSNTLNELKQVDLATWKRTVVYSYGAAEGLLLDRILPHWKDEYFRQMLSTDACFDPKK